MKKSFFSQVVKVLPPLMLPAGKHPCENASPGFSLPTRDEVPPPRNARFLPQTRQRQTRDPRCGVVRRHMCVVNTHRNQHNGYSLDTGCTLHGDPARLLTGFQSKTGSARNESLPSFASDIPVSLFQLNHATKPFS